MLAGGPTLADTILERIAATEAWIAEEVFFGYMRMRNPLAADCRRDRRLVRKHHGHGDCGTMRELAARYSGGEGVGSAS